MTVGEAAGMLVGGLTDLVPVTALVGFAVGTLSGMALDSAWSWHKGYEQGRRDGLADRPPSASWLQAKAVGDKITEDAMVELAEARAAKDGPRTPHFDPGHVCTPACYFNPDRERPW